MDSLLLVEFLDNYAETGNQYVEVLKKKIIKQNNLKDFDDAKLLPTSIELEKFNLIYNCKLSTKPSPNSIII